MEKIKDFLYDMSDVVISLMIVAIIFYVVSWKLNESMPVEFKFGEAVASENTIPTDAPPVETPSEDTVNRPIEETTEVPTDTVAPTEAPVSPPATAGQKIAITIPSGATGFSIAKALKEKGLIEDVNAFIKHVEELKLGNRLTAGTFNLTTDMTEEQIIKKIANVK